MQSRIPELLTRMILHTCEQHCPKKIPPKSKPATSVRIPSRRKRKLQSQLKEALKSPTSPSSQVLSLWRKLALAQIDIRDAIIEDHLRREQQAVRKVKDNPKCFYSYATKFSKKKNNISMLFDNNGIIKSKPN